MRLSLAACCRHLPRWTMAAAVWASVVAPGAAMRSGLAAEEACDGVGGTVVEAATGGPVAGAVVSLLDRTEVSDRSGGFCFRRVPARRTVEMSLSVRDRHGTVTSCSVFDLEVRFLAVSATDGSRVAVAVVDPAVDRQVVLRLERVAAEEVDRFCVRCHRWNPCLEPGSEDDPAETRKFLRGIVVSAEEVERIRRQVERNALDKEGYARILYTDTHAAPMDVRRAVAESSGGVRERYRRPARLSLVDGATSCDTCHTRHVPTPHGAYAVMPYRGLDSDLCSECHL